MRKIFSVLNLICIIASVIFVGVNFFSKIETGKNAFSSLANFTSSSENSILVSELEDCAYMVDVRISNLTSEQKEYVYELSSVVERFNEFFNYLSPRLLLDNARSSSARSIINKINSLAESRSIFLEETERFKIKVSGNLYGDTLTSYNHFIKSFLNYLSDYNSCMQIVNNHLKSNNLTVFNTIELYGFAIDYLLDSYTDLTFNNNAFLTIKEINSLIGLYNSTNLVTAEDSGLISLDASNFNYYYNLCEKSNLIEKFYSTSINLTLDENSNNITHCVYYFYQIFRGNL